MTKKTDEKTKKKPDPKPKKATSAAPPENKEARLPEQSQQQAADTDLLVPGAWVLPWMVLLAGGINNAAYVLAWLLGVRVADSGPALAYHRIIDGDVYMAIKKAKLAELLGLGVEAVEEGIKRLRESGLITSKVREDAGVKKTFVRIDLDAVRAAKSQLPSKEPTDA